MPEVIEVEPVVRRQARIVCQPVRKSLQNSGERLGAAVALDDDALRERLEVQVVAIAAAIQAERQHHRHFQRGGQQPGRNGERRRAAQEVRGLHGIVRLPAIRQQRDDRVAVQRLLDRDGDARARRPAR